MFGAASQASESWLCVWGDPNESDNRGFGYTLEDDALIVDQTGDVFHILQNNQFGIVASGSISEFVPIRKKAVIGFFSIAINKSTGDAVQADGVIGDSNPGILHGKCTKR